MIAYNGRLYHDKAIRAYYYPKDKPRYLKPFSQKLKTALENGEANYIKTGGKYIYLYDLKNKKRVNT